MSRHDDWPERLDRFIAENRGRPFEWGRLDCALFAADWVREATGRDPAAAFRGRYSTAIGAARALFQIGAGKDMPGERLGVPDMLLPTWTALEGAPLASPLLAQRGDVVAVETEYGPALGVFLGHGIACVTPAGLAFLPLTAAEAAWRV